MAEPTLIQVFGANATQTANTLTISKTDLAAVGLTATASNTPESLFVAIFKLVALQLNPTNQEQNPDMQVTIESSFPSIVYRNNQSYRQSTFTLGLQKLDNSAEIDPDDY